MKQENDMETVEPLPDAELVRVVRSAWRYEQDGRNWSGWNARAVLDIDEIRGLEPDAVYLLVLARGTHGKDNRPFAFGQGLRINLGWGSHRFQRARDALLEAAMLKLVAPSALTAQGRMPALFVLGKPSCRFDKESN